MSQDRLFAPIKEVIAWSVLTEMARRQVLPEEVRTASFLLSANEYTVALDTPKLLGWDSHVFDPKHLTYCSVCALSCDFCRDFPSRLSAPIVCNACASEECSDVSLLFKHMYRKTDGYVAYCAEDMRSWSRLWRPMLHFPANRAAKNPDFSSFVYPETPISLK